MMVKRVLLDVFRSSRASRAVFSAAFLAAPCALAQGGDAPALPAAGTVALGILVIACAVGGIMIIRLKD
jgi:hypothetical protein